MNKKVVVAIIEGVVTAASLALGLYKGKLAKVELHDEISKIAAEKVAEEFAKRASEVVEEL